MNYRIIISTDIIVHCLIRWTTCCNMYSCKSKKEDDKIKDLEYFRIVSGCYSLHLYFINPLISLKKNVQAILDEFQNFAFLSL